MMFRNVQDENRSTELEAYEASQLFSVDPSAYRNIEDLRV